MNFQTIAAQLEFLAWRDAQMSAVSLQLEEAFPALLDDLSKKVETASILNLVRSTLALKSSVEASIQRWGAEQLALALTRAEAELDQTIQLASVGVDLSSDTWEQVIKALPAIAGVGLIGASLAAIPAVISFATVSTGILAILGASTISWPLVALGAAGVGVGALTGSSSLKFAEGKARGKLCSRIHREAGRRVFGIGKEPGARCVLSDIQAAIVQAGRNRIEGVA